MSSLLYFHLKTSEVNNVVTALKNLTGIQQAEKGEFPINFHREILQNIDTDPNYLVVFANGSEWTTVAINSFKKLHKWGEQLSAELKTVFVQTTAQNTSDAYYFLMYDKGQLKREIEVNHGYEEDIVDLGEKLPFEHEVIHQVADDEDDCIFFDWDTLEYYCKQLGFQFIPDDEGNYFHTLKVDTIGLTMDAYHNQRVDNMNRPWWKFW
jgi:hypothetical protein